APQPVPTDTRNEPPPAQPIQNQPNPITHRHIRVLPGSHPNAPTNRATATQTPSHTLRQPNTREENSCPPTWRTAVRPQGTTLSAHKENTCPPTRNSRCPLTHGFAPEIISWGRL